MGSDPGLHVIGSIGQHADTGIFVPATSVLHNLIGRTDLELKIITEHWVHSDEVHIVVAARLPNGNIHRFSCRENDFPTQEMITKLQVLA